MCPSVGLPSCLPIYQYPASQDLATVSVRTLFYKAQSHRFPSSFGLGVGGSRSAKPPPGAASLWLLATTMQTPVIPTRHDCIHHTMVRIPNKPSRLAQIPAVPQTTVSSRLSLICTERPGYCSEISESTNAQVPRNCRSRGMLCQTLGAFLTLTWCSGCRI